MCEGFQLSVLVYHPQLLFGQDWREEELEKTRSWQEISMEIKRLYVIKEMRGIIETIDSKCLQLTNFQQSK